MMANIRTRLLKMLSNAEEALAEAEAITAELPFGTEDERRSVSLLPGLRDAVRRVQYMLDHTSDRAQVGARDGSELERSDRNVEALHLHQE